MRMADFVKQYCADITDKYAKLGSALTELDGFPYDAIVYDIDGSPVKVVYASGYEIPISDILSLDRSEFEKAYPYHECLKVYDNYMEAVIVLEGPEALAAIRNKILSEQKRVDYYSSLPEVL